MPQDGQFREPYELQCRWGECTQVLATDTSFIIHVARHCSDFLSTLNSLESGEKTLCLWEGCSTLLPEDQQEGSSPPDQGLTEPITRHVTFHAFHTKVKYFGQKLCEHRKLPKCHLDPSSAHTVPYLPEPLKCSWSDCDYEGNNANIFYHHVDQHTDLLSTKLTTFTCSWIGCSVSVNKKSKLKDHMKSHTQRKVIGCHHCGCLFSNNTKLVDHLHRQNLVNGQTYQCSHCGKQSTTSRLLIVHMRKHVNSCRCPHCELMCQNPSALKRHIKYRHTDDRQFPCSLCDFRAKSVSDLRTHTDSHRSDCDAYRCDVDGCDFTGRTYQLLTNHQRSVHSEGGSQKNQYACHLCTSTFKVSSSLSNHLRKKHEPSWFDGLTKFRYMLHDDGYHRLQTVRYEMLDDATPGLKTADGTLATGSMAVGDLATGMVATGLMPSLPMATRTAFDSTHTVGDGFPTMTTSTAALSTSERSSSSTGDHGEITPHFSAIEKTTYISGPPNFAGINLVRSTKKAQLVPNSEFQQHAGPSTDKEASEETTVRGAQLSAGRKRQKGRPSLNRHVRQSSAGTSSERRLMPKSFSSGDNSLNCTTTSHCTNKVCHQGLSNQAVPPACILESNPFTSVKVSSSDSPSEHLQLSSYSLGQSRVSRPRKPTEKMAEWGGFKKKSRKGGQ